MNKKGSFFGFKGIIGNPNPKKRKQGPTPGPSHKAVAIFPRKEGLQTRLALDTPTKQLHK